MDLKDGYLAWAAGTEEYHVATSGRLLVKGTRTITIAATIRHESNGRLTPVIAYTKQVTEAEYTNHIQAAIKKGAQSIAKVLRRQPPAIPDAFHHPRLGPIGLDFDGAKHIVDQRMSQLRSEAKKNGRELAQGEIEKATAEVILAASRTAILGMPLEDLGNPEKGQKHSRITLVHGEHEVIVEPRWQTRYPQYANGQTTWIVTGYRMSEQRQAARAAEGHLAVKFDAREKK